MSLHPILGHEEARASFTAAHARGSLPSALLIHGPKGVGKQRLALWLASLLVCDRPQEAPCGACGPCRMAGSLEHPDIHWYFPLERPKKVSGDRLVEALERARMEALAEIRDDSLWPSYSSEVKGLYVATARNIRSRAHKRPTMAGPVFIIGDADSLVPQEASPEAANALLKLLEEPPGAARFILTSSEPGSLLPTIRSRTVPYQVSGLPRDEVARFLEEHAGADAKTSGWAATLSRGSLGRALAFLPDGGDLGILEGLRRKAYDVVAAATAERAAEGYGVALSFPPAGARGLIELFAFVEEWLRDLAAVAAGAHDQAFNRDALARLERHVAESGIQAVDVPRAFTEVEKARELARGNVNPQLVVSGLIRALRECLVAKRATLELSR